MKNKKIKAGLIVLILVGLIGFGIIEFVFAEGDEGLEVELANLSSELVESGYDWLVNYSVDYPSADIEVYLENGEEVVALIENVSVDGEYKVYLSGGNASGGGVGLGSEEIGFVNESYVFDLKVVCSSGGVGVEGNESVGNESVDGDESGECYDNKTEILTEQGWKLFSELNKNEKVMTLNSETGEREWQLPSVYQVFDNSDLGGEMYKILIEDMNGVEGEIVVSKEHRVYVNKENKKGSNGMVKPNWLIPNIFCNASKYLNVSVGLHC